MICDCCAKRPTASEDDILCVECKPAPKCKVSRSWWRKGQYGFGIPMVWPTADVRCEVRS